MAYATATQIYKRVPEDTVRPLTDDNNTGRVNTGVLASLQEKAYNKINSMLSKAYTVPFSSPYPPEIVDIEIDLMSYYLFLRRNDDDTMPKYIVEGYKDAIETLKSFRSGEQEIIDVDRRVTSPTLLRINKTSDDQVFTSTVMDNWGLQRT